MPLTEELKCGHCWNQNLTFFLRIFLLRLKLLLSVCAGVCGCLPFIGKMIITNGASLLVLLECVVDVAWLNLRTNTGVVGKMEIILEVFTVCVTNNVNHKVTTSSSLRRFV